MKIIATICLAILLASAVMSRTTISSIYGSIDPPDAGVKVLATNTTDTVVVIPQDGKFSIAVTGGMWQLFVLAKRPYKDAYIDRIRVVEGKSTDVGKVRLISE